MSVPAWLIVLVAGLCLGAPRASLAQDVQPGAAPTPELAAKGKDLYSQLCSHCHGVNMVNPGTVSFDLRKFPHDDRARFLNSVTHGKGNMPAWGDILHPDEIDALWAYVLTGGQQP